MKLLSYKFYLAIILLAGLSLTIISFSTYIGWGLFGPLFMVFGLNAYAYICYYKAWKHQESYWIGPISDYAILMIFGYTIPCLLAALIFTMQNNTSPVLEKIATNSTDYIKLITTFRSLGNADSLNLNSVWGVTMASVSYSIFVATHIAFYFCIIPAIPMSKTWAKFYRRVNSSKAVLYNFLFLFIGFFTWRLIRIPIDFLFIAEIDAPWKNMPLLDYNIFTSNFTTLFIIGPLYPLIISICLAGAFAYFMREPKSEPNNA